MESFEQACVNWVLGPGVTREDTENEDLEIRSSSSEVTRQQH